MPSDQSRYRANRQTVSVAEVEALVASYDCFQNVNSVTKDGTATVRFDIVPSGDVLQSRDAQSSLSVRTDDWRSYNATLRFPTLPKTASTAQLHSVARDAAARGGFLTDSIERHRSTGERMYVHLDVDAARDIPPTDIPSDDCFDTTRLVDRLATTAQVYVGAFE